VGDTAASIVQHGTKSLESYNAYLQGLFFWNKRTAADLKRAIEHFQRSIAVDSGFAKAWAGLAATYVLYTPSEYNITDIAPVEALTRAERAARRALALNERSVEAYAALGNALDQRGHSQEAEEAFQRAIAIDPRYATAHQWYATPLAKLGRQSDALEHVLIAQRLDPLSLVIGAEAAEHLDAAGRTAEATAQYERMLERYSSAYVLNLFAGLHFLIQRDFARGAPLVAGLALDVGADSAASRRLEIALRDSATRTNALRSLAEGTLPNAVALTAVPEVRIAAYRSLGDDEGAIRAFEQAVDGPLYERIYINHVRAILGPELSARPRAQAATQRFVARLRARG